jgi:CYTH domain-containing protein
MLEIERKFLMDGFPIGLELLAEVEIEQGYISFNPEVRIRKAVDRFTGKEEFWLTIKGDGDVARDEIETEITSDFYYDTLDFLGVRMIQKDYKKYRLGPWKLEVSHIDPETDWAFYYAEVEFPTVEDAKEFVVPNYFGREITFSEDYKMKNYWKRTRR